MRRPNERFSEIIAQLQQAFIAKETEIIRRGTQIYGPHEPAESILLVHSGRVGLFLRDASRSLTLCIVEHGQLFGHVALADPHYDAHAEALSDVCIQRADRGSVQAAISTNPPLGLALFEELGRYRQSVSARLDDLAFKSVPARLASLLLDMAQRHGGPAAASVPRPSHRQLAEQINAYRETVTKVINQFRAARLLEIEASTITLLNLRRLEELAQS